MAALGTSRLRLAPCVTDPYTRHPAITAMQIATLDEITGRRALLVMGAGRGGFREMGLAQPSPATALKEAVVLIRQLLRGETVTYEGKIVRFHDGRGGGHRARGHAGQRAQPVDEGPRSLDHRYAHEDVGWGLVPWSEMGRALGVATLTMDALITLASVMNGIDYRRDGLTLERLGLAGKDLRTVDRYLHNGP